MVTYRVRGQERRRGNDCLVVCANLGWGYGQTSEERGDYCERDDAQSRITQEYGIGKIPNGNSPVSLSSDMVGM